MANIYQWTNDTPLGFINDELTGLWVPVDAATAQVATNVTDIADLRTDLDATRYHIPFGDAGSGHGSGATGSLWDVPTKTFADAATHTMRQFAILPFGSRQSAMASELNVYWAVNNAGAAANIYVDITLEAMQVEGIGGGAVTGTTLQAVAVGTDGSYTVKKTTVTDASYNYVNKVGISMLLQRQGAHASDTYTDTIWFLGAEVILTEA